jgi:hypothetical protein
MALNLSVIQDLLRDDLSVCCGAGVCTDSVTQIDVTSWVKSKVIEAKTLKMAIWDVPKAGNSCGRAAVPL